MKTIIAGSRTITDYKTVEEAIKESGFEITQVISGGAKGVDTIAIQWAKNNGVPFIVMNADWGTHGRAAGPIRNIEMAKEGEALIVVYDGKSSGSIHMIKTGLKYNLESFVKVVE